MVNEERGLINLTKDGFSGDGTQHAIMPRDVVNIITITQHRECTYNLTLTRVRLTTVVVKKQQVLQIMRECVCV